MKYSETRIVKLHGVIQVPKRQWSRCGCVDMLELYESHNMTNRKQFMFESVFSLTANYRPPIE